MSTFPVRKTLLFIAFFLGTALAIRYLGPVIMPFLSGALLALAAEPAVSFGVRRLHLPRPLSSGLGVSITLILLAATLWLLGALTVKELGQLAGAMPNIQQTVSQGLILLQDFMIGIADRAPDGLRSVLTGVVLELFGSSSALLSRITGRLPGLLSAFLGKIPGGAISLVTGILAGFMISARLPKLRLFFARKIPPKWKERYLPALLKLRKTLGAWLKAQLKLMGVTYGIVTAGLLLSGVSFAPVWALAVALVDAVPVLGTGAVLIPWAAIALLQGRTFQAVGIACTWLGAMLTRTTLEPRLVGRQLGLDPLVTLVAFYVGFKFFGVLGMLLAPMLAAAAKSLITSN